MEKKWYELFFDDKIFVACCATILGLAALFYMDSPVDIAPILTAIVGGLFGVAVGKNSG